MIHPDHIAYFRCTSKLRIDKALNTLIGILQGIDIDKEVSGAELNFLREWLCSLEDVAHRHPFNEIVPVINEALSDGVFSEDEKEDVLWLCEKMQKVVDGYDPITSDIQKLQGMLAGILADGVVDDDEVHALSEWIDEHDHLKSCWPYDEIESLITQVLKDGVIDDSERKKLETCFSEFIQMEGDRTITNPTIIDDRGNISGLCAVCPDIDFSGSVFCFTGASTRFSRTELVGIVDNLGGQFLGNVSKKIDYLVIGTNGNPCWAYTCYGRKVEQAVTLRKQGHNIVLLHENDFMDAVQDNM